MLSQPQQHQEEDVGGTLDPTNGFLAATCSLSVMRFSPSAWTQEMPKSLPSIEVSLDFHSWDRGR